MAMSSVSTGTSRDLSQTIFLKRPCFQASEKVETVVASEQIAIGKRPDAAPRAQGAIVTAGFPAKRNCSACRHSGTGSKQTTRAPLARNRAALPPTFAPTSKIRTLRETSAALPLDARSPAKLSLSLAIYVRVPLASTEESCNQARQFVNSPP